MHRTPELIRQDMQDAAELTAQQLEQAIEIAEDRSGQNDERSRNPALIGAILIALGGQLPRRQQIGSRQRPIVKSRGPANMDQYMPSMGSECPA